MSHVYALYFRFSVCGRVVIEKVPEGLSQVAKERKIVVHPADKPDKLTTLLTDTTGRFCGQLASGSYVVKVGLYSTVLNISQ